MPKRTVVGAGLSGMVAAIDLARQGDEVLILEKEKAIGGSPAYHPSLHATPIDFKYTSDFIGIDVSPCFKLLAETQLWVRDTRLYPNLNHYGVERGDRETAIDTYLYKMCLDHGVQFEFGHPVKRLKDIPPGSIVATGTMCTVDDFTVHKRIEGYGYAFVMDAKLGPANWQFADMYSPDYFYAVAMNGILYGLVFGRRTRIAEDALDVIGRQCRERAGFEIEGWKPFFCETMIGTRLFFGPGRRYIMTGSASGSYDPYLGYGIVGALTSGKVSALALRDRDGAQVLFNRMNRHHMYLYQTFEIVARLPRALKFKMLTTMPAYYKYTKVLFNRLGHGIPGYPRDWMEEFTRD